MHRSTVIAACAAPLVALAGDTPQGTGLDAFWWEANLTSVNQIPGTAPDGSFTSTALDYPAGETDQAADTDTTVAGFIAPDDASLSGGDSDDMLDKAFAFRGRLRVEPADDTDPGTPGIQVAFAIGSNDGATMTAGCETVVDNDGIHGFTVRSGTHTFPEPGLYRVEVRFITNNNDYGIEWWSSSDTDPRADAPAGTVGIVPTGRLYPLAACPADLAAPAGVLDLSDVGAFIAGFLAQDPSADQNGDCVFDLIDVNTFTSTFLAGCG